MPLHNVLDELKRVYHKDKRDNMLKFNESPISNNNNNLNESLIDQESPLLHNKDKKNKMEDTTDPSSQFDKVFNFGDKRKEILLKQSSINSKKEETCYNRERSTNPGLKSE